MPHTRIASAQSIVQDQLDAYNAHDVTALTALYADDAELFQHPATLLATGSVEIRARFASRFATARPHALLLKRIVAGQIVIDHETVTSLVGDGTESANMVAMYQVEGERIAKAWFMSGPLLAGPGA